MCFCCRCCQMSRLVCNLQLNRYLQRSSITSSNPPYARRAASHSIAHVQIIPAKLQQAPSSGPLCLDFLGLGRNRLFLRLLSFFAGEQVLNSTERPPDGPGKLHRRDELQHSSNTASCLVEHVYSARLPMAQPTKAPCSVRRRLL